MNIRYKEASHGQQRLLRPNFRAQFFIEVLFPFPTVLAILVTGAMVISFRLVANPTETDYAELLGKAQAYFDTFYDETATVTKPLIKSSMRFHARIARSSESVVLAAKFPLLPG